jgi:PAS domain S-box-containing protein
MRVPRRRLPAPFHGRLGVCAAVCLCLSILLTGSGTALATGAGRTLRIIGFTDSSVAPGSTLVNPGGFIVDVMNEAARRAGFTLDWRAVGKIQANTEALRSGEMDLLPGKATAERRRLFYVTEPWWSVYLVALVPADSPIRQESDLRGRRLAVLAEADEVVESTYARSALVLRGSSVEAAEAVCRGAADAAVVGGSDWRLIFLAAPPSCAGVNLRAVDSQVRLDYSLIARPAVADAARTMKRALDSLTADGTLASIAARHPEISTPYAIRLAELIRMRYELRFWAIALGAGSAFILLGAAFTVNLLRSRRRLRAANVQLEVDLEARIRAEAALRDSEARFRTLFDSAPQTVLAMDRDGVIVFANRKSEDMFGYAPGQLVGKSMAVLLPERLHAGFRENRLVNKPEAAGLRAEGREFPIEISLGSVETSEGLTLAFIGDISERVALQKQFLQAQKLESVGQLAGGVAHDFNNLLTIVSGYAQMALDGGVGAELREPLHEIASAAERAAGLTRQLMMFSRRQTAAPRILSLNELLANLEKMLRRLIGEDIDLVLSLDPGVAAVRADPVHIEQVILNLAVNARDAMPGGGRLLVETAVFHADGAYAGEHLDVPPGEYAALKVSDTGCGMTPEVRAHIFEPFFTTKEQGKGTGLGLSTVYGIVKQTGGAILVYSEPGRGTAFKILLPSAEAGQRAEALAAETPVAMSGSETILLAEDEVGVRRFVRDVLRAQGYRVLEAADGGSALEIAVSDAGPIHLLLTDLVMPEMGGIDLARRFSELYPDAPILLMSGYSDRAFAPSLAQAVIEKPFVTSVLLRRVREVLDQHFAGSQAGPGTGYRT